MNRSMRIFLFAILCCCYPHSSVLAVGGFAQTQEGDYLARFNQIMEASYSQVDDLSSGNLNRPPQELIDQCKNGGIVNPTNEIIVMTTDGSDTISSSLVESQCGLDTVCIIPEGLTLQMNGNLNVGGLIVRGNLEWTGSTQSSENQFLCGGFVVVEQNGSFDMRLSKSKNGWIYIKNNGAEHPQLQTRSFGTYKDQNTSDNPVMTIRGRRDLERTWSLLSEPLTPGSEKMKLLHDPIQMGWIVGDRLGIAPTEPMARGWGQVVRILDIEEDGTIALDGTIEHTYRADFKASTTAKIAALLSAEVVNLSRNIVITGDDFEQVSCTPDLPEAVPGEQSSVKGCKCSYRTKCTVGLHTMQKHGGVTKIENTRIEKCGQRGIEGKYCLHFHKMEDCPDCLFKGNAIENSQQRGIIVHGTHNSRVVDNVLYNVRGANVYLEDGNEMWNTLAYNVAVCPFPIQDSIYGGCTVPGTSNVQADTRLNQAGFYSNGAATNNFIGNRAANHFNGMFLDGGEMGRGSANGEVCESSSRLGRFDGNTWHGNGRFGTYALGRNYPQETDQSVAFNGINVDKELCNAFDAEGRTHGLPGAFVNHVDYGNLFVGHYSAGDIQYSGHHSVENIHLIYWKETKNFQNGCGSHIMNGYYSEGDMLLPDQATFIIDNAFIDDNVLLSPNHHCNVGITGFLCMPQYILHNVKWKNENRNKQWVKFQFFNTQFHGANQNHGGIFALSPPQAAIVKAGGTVEDSMFPDGYISLVSNKFSHLLQAPNNLCVDSTPEHGNLYDNGILCKAELRALKIYTKGLISNGALTLRVEVWFKPGGDQSGSPDMSQEIGFHQIGGDNETRKQGYSVPVIPGIDHSYHLSLVSGDGDLPNDWVIEFSDPVIGNRWSVDELILTVAGRECGDGGLISSQHDRKFIWGGNRGFLDDKVWSHHGACVGAGPDKQPPDEEDVECNTPDNIFDFDGRFAGIIDPTHCPEKCNEGCNSNSYCDCGSESCECKAGYTGADCQIDVCASALCSEHGSCSARYLGRSVPVIEKACICEDTWLGERCDRSPCVEMDIDCGTGLCIALSETEATCECPDGYFGANCEERSACESFCKGDFPYFGCAKDIEGKIKLGCDNIGGCNYVDAGSNYPYDGFCTYKSYETNVISTKAPTMNLTKEPTKTPTRIPSRRPSSVPSAAPSAVPSLDPSSSPSGFPSGSPSGFPSGPPTQLPQLSCDSVLNQGECKESQGCFWRKEFVCQDFSKKSCEREGCIWNMESNECWGMWDGPDCENGNTKSNCNVINGCSWKFDVCQKALSSTECAQYKSKKKKCKKNGCIFNKNPKDCQGRWDEEIMM